MLKFTDTQVTFAEVPDHITLCINISNCPCHCTGCHSPYLAEDIGTVLTTDILKVLIKENNGISCICFMGGDSDPKEVNILASVVKKNFPNIQVAWYSGRQELAKDININNFDYIKLGPYLKEYGPLSYKTTNQRFYRILHFNNHKSKMFDITYKFFKYED